MFISSSKFRFFIGYMILAFLFLVLPFFTNHDVLVEDIIVWGLFTMGFNLAFGFTGMVSLGHGVYFGVSAYTIGILSLFWSRSIITIPIGIGVGTLSGLLVGYTSLKRARLDLSRVLKVAYLVLISVAALFVANYVFMSPLAKYSGAEMGLLGFRDKPMRVMGNIQIDFNSHLQIYLIIGIVSLLVILWLHRIASSPAAIIMRAIRENEVRVGFLGYNTFRFKLLIYVISSFVASVAGWLYLFRSGYISVDVFDFPFNVEFIIICLLGGRNTFFGPLVGTAIFIILKDVISSYTASWGVFLALALIFTILYLPHGLAPALVSLPRVLVRLMKGRGNSSGMKEAAPLK